MNCSETIIDIKKNSYFSLKCKKRIFEAKALENCITKDNLSKRGHKDHLNLRSYNLADKVAYYCNRL